MSARLWFAALALGGVVAAVPERPAAVVPAVEQDATTTIDDQAELAVTVYNSDIALVRDVRNLQLARGVSDLRFMDIAATVNPATVHFRSLTEPSRVSVLEQNYEYDLLEPDKLLRKYVGRDVTLVRMRQAGGSTREEEVRARLLSYNSAPVWQIGNEIVTGMHADHIRFPELPDSLYSRPTLIWTVQNDGAARHRVEASYLAGKLAWNADYVLTVARDDRTADLDGWVTLTNGSGTSFRNASLQLVAGDLNRVRQMLGRMRADEALASAPAAERAAMQQESFSDYHLYTLGRKTSINNSETKQVSMLDGTGVPIRKRYVVEGQAVYYHNQRHPGSPIKDLVQVFYEFRNDEGAGLGMPMPAGVVRVYQADSRGGIQFVGEDRINHTPKDETLNVKIGNAFDVVCERNQVDFQKIAGNVYEVEYEITVRNHKAAPVAVEVSEPIGGTWDMIRASHQWTKTAAWAARFAVPVAANAERCSSIACGSATDSSGTLAGCLEQLHRRHTLLVRTSQRATNLVLLLEDDMTVAADRRMFLKFLGSGMLGSAAGAGPLGPIAEARGAMPFQGANAAAEFAVSVVLADPAVRPRRSPAAARLSVSARHRLRRPLHQCRRALRLQC